MSENQQQQDENIEVERQNLIYSLNQQDATASIIDGANIKNFFIIPHSIYYKLKHYDITSISNGAFKCSKVIYISFSPQSQIKTIEKSAFGYSSIVNLTIPSSLVNLEKGWCEGASKLTVINIDKNNPRYKKYEDKFIIGKTSIENDEFDILVFASRDIKIAKIPSFIKYIEPYAFDSCTQLESIEFQENSKLQIIDEYAFYLSSIESITIPKHVTRIQNGAFSNCSKLSRVDFEEDSELEIIGESAFNNTIIENFTIPNHLRKIKDCAFINAQRLKKIDIQDDSEIQTIGNKAFLGTKIECLNFPPKLVNLKKMWCACTENLNRIIVSPKNPRYSLINGGIIIGKSTLESDEYDELVFCARDVENVFVPNFIKRICPFAFNQCLKLQKVEFPYDSKLQIIDKNAFTFSSIMNISIPKNVTNICEGSFSACNNLRTIGIPENSELQKIDYFAFLRSPIEYLSIPSKFNIDNAFWSDMDKLIRMDVSQNHPLYSTYDNKMIIGKSSIEDNEYDSLIFCFRDQKNVTIPRFIKRIKSYAFQNCRCKKVEFEANSEIEEIERFAFVDSLIESFTIPSHIRIINDGAFENCNLLRKLEVEKDSELEIIDKNAFSKTAIESFTIPSHLTKICESAFGETPSLKKVYVPDDSELKIIEADAFFETAITSFTIPSHVTKLCLFSFAVDNFQILEIMENSEIEFIDSRIFFDARRMLIMIPAYLADLRNLVLTKFEI